MLAEKTEGLLAGWGSAEITPAPPCPMGGYAARSAPAASIHDPLYAQALVFGSAGTGSASLGVVICDLLEIPRELLQIVRQRAAALFPGLTLWLGATHTHSGPALPQHLAAGEAGTIMPETFAASLIERITTGVLTALRRAVAALQPVRLTWASGQTHGIVTNRDHPGSGEDTALDLLCLSAVMPAHVGQRQPTNEIAEEEQRPPLAAVVGSFPCHPTVLSAANLALSADLPGAFRRQLRSLLASDCWVMLATGAAGDMSTRHTRQGQDMTELERLGGLLASQAATLLPSARPLVVGAPQLRHTTLELPLKTPPDPELLASYERQLQESLALAVQAGQQAQTQAQMRTLETALQGIRALRSMCLSPELVERQVELAVARLGELALVAVPGELYNRLGVAIRQATGQPVLLFGYTNGYAGYLPARDAYGALDYEVLVSPFAPGAGEQVVQAVQTLLNAGE